MLRHRLCAQVMHAGAQPLATDMLAPPTLMDVISTRIAWETPLSMGQA